MIAIDVGAGLVEGCGGKVGEDGRCLLWARKILQKTSLKGHWDT